jgi:hypothetical protein
VSAPDFDFGLPFLNDEIGTPLCAETDPEAFFPQDVPGHKIPSYYDEQGAKKICGACDYRVDCLIFALKNNEIGIWGGTTEGQRKLMRRQAKIKGLSVKEIAVQISR